MRGAMATDAGHRRVGGLLLAREGELSVIEELLARAGAGCGAVALVEGPAGIGKSALLAQATRGAAGSGFGVLRAAGGQLERQFAFGVARQLFAPVVGAGEARCDLLEGAAGLAAGPLGLLVAEREAAGAAGDLGDRASAAMHGLYWLTLNLSERAPLLLVLDDAHWADAMSLAFVCYLARRLEDAPVLVLVAARPAPRSGEDEPLAQLHALQGLRLLRPAPLSEPAVARLIGESGLRGAHDDFVVACHHASGGNPFLLGELLGALLADHAGGSAADAVRVAQIAPQSIARAVLARLVALGGDAQRLASAFAVLGAGALLSDAVALAELQPPAAAAAVDALIAAHILTAERPYEFVHPLVQGAIHDGLPPAGRAEAHARAARLTAQAAAPLGRVAAHLLAADPARDGWAIEMLRAAAREASANGAPASAASYLQRALHESPARALRAELLLELGQAQLQAGIPGATARIRATLELQDDPRRRAEICLTLGHALYYTGDYAAARETFSQGLAELGDAADDLFLELRGWYISVARHDAQSRAVGLERLAPILESETPGRTRMERYLLAQLGYEWAQSGEQPHHKVAKLAHRAFAQGALFQDTGNDIGIGWCLTLLFVGEPDAAIAALNDAIESYQRRGSRVAFGWASMFRGCARYMRGELLDAIADLESATDAYNDAYTLGLPATRAFLALCLLERGDLAGAAQLLTLPGGEEPWVSQNTFNSYLCALGRFKGVTGEPREGLDTLLEGGRRLKAMNSPNPAANLPWRSDAALLAARLGQPDQAAELVAEEVKLASAFGAPHAVGIALRAAGLIQGGPDGLARLEQAVALLDATGINLELARALTDHGAALRRGGYPRDARQPLRRGLDLALACGALALAGRAREELTAAGARPRRQRISGADALTASERRVARMAADGMTNRQIAQALFVTPNTVAIHLTHTYQKLDIKSRTQLPDALNNPTTAAPQAALTH
jgi:DNA-binding CsgD family transcriptional regulator